MSTLRVAIIDDHAIVRAGLRQFFSEQVDLTVVAEASNGREAVDIVRKGQVDVLVMDLSMPDQSGVDALAAIKARASSTLVSSSSAVTKGNRIVTCGGIPRSTVSRR